MWSFSVPGGGCCLQGVCSVPSRLPGVEWRCPWELLSVHNSHLQSPQQLVSQNATAQAKKKNPYPSTGTRRASDTYRGIVTSREMNNSCPHQSWQKRWRGSVAKRTAQEGHTSKSSLSIYTERMALQDREAYVTYKMESWDLRHYPVHQFLHPFFTVALLFKRNFIIVETGWPLIGIYYIILSACVYVWNFPYELFLKKECIET